MKFLAVACLLGVALSIKIDETESALDGIDGTLSAADLAILSEECTDANGTNIDCDPIEDQIDDTEKLKVFEKAQVPSDYMYFKSPTYKAKTRQDKMDELWNELVPTYAENP